MLSSYDLCLLPPCRKSLRLHIQRCNYQTLIWNKANEPNPAIPSPAGHGWLINSRGKLDIAWVDENILPTELIDVLDIPRPQEGEEEDLCPELVSMEDVFFEDLHESGSEQD